jgi:hypothetical protein
MMLPEIIWEEIYWWDALLTLVYQSQEFGEHLHKSACAVKC